MWTIEQEIKEGFLTALATTIKDPTASIRKYTNELKVYEKTAGTSIEQYLSPDLKPLDYALLDVLENETNSISRPNVDSLKTAIEKE